jgi:5-formyltetrahydrofolate cyclo-ligase
LTFARQAHSSTYRQEIACQLAETAASVEALWVARRVASYVSWPSEPGTEVLNANLLRGGVSLLLPAVGSDVDLRWSVVAPGEDVASVGHKPSDDATALATADVVLVPALAVDSRGTRLGQGAGWYDRMLAFASAGALLVAVVHDDEFFDAATAPLPREPHDRLVGAVLTPSAYRVLT